MSVYDEVCGQQVKCTSNPSLKSYGLGDRVSLIDGCYITYEGAFIIDGGIVQAATRQLWTKYGDVLDPKVILDVYNPVAIAIKQVRLKEEK